MERFVWLFYCFRLSREPVGVDSLLDETTRQVTFWHITAFRQYLLGTQRLFILANCLP